MCGKLQKSLDRWIKAILIFLILSGGALAKSPLSTPTPTETGQQPKANAQQKKKQAKPDQRGTVEPPLVIKNLPSKTNAENTDKTTDKKNDYTSPEWALVCVTAILTLFTGGLMWFTAKLWGANKILVQDAKATADRQAREMQESLRIARDNANAARDDADIARDAMVAGERAFVFAVGTKPYWIRQPDTGLYHWQFRPQWQNSGDTPTKNLTMHTECVVRDTPLPPGFVFDDPTHIIGTGLIPPKITNFGGLAPTIPISPQVLLDVQAGKKFLYLWGWARYWDVFLGTPQHITRFCWAVLPNGDPMAFTPDHPDSLIFDTIHHTEGNCADDECDQ